MNNQQHDRLVEWILASHLDGTLGRGSLDDVCERASVAVGFDVDHMDYIAGRRDSRCARVMGAAIGDGHDLMIEHPVPVPPAPKGERLPRLRLAPLTTPLAELDPTEARRVLVALVVEAASLSCAVSRDDLLKPGQGFREVSAARNIIAFTLSGLVPDETPHGVAMLLSELFGLSEQTWHTRLDRRACAKSDRLAALVLEVDDMLDAIGVEPLRGAVVRKIGRPRKSQAPAGHSGGNQPRVAVRGSAGACDSSGGAR
jgi:hypothetical protein